MNSILFVKLPGDTGGLAIALPAIHVSRRSHDSPGLTVIIHAPSNDGIGQDRFGVSGEL